MPSEPGSCGQAGSLLAALSQGFLSLFFCPPPRPSSQQFQIKVPLRSVVCPLCGVWGGCSAWDGRGAGRGRELLPVTAFSRTGPPGSCGRPCPCGECGPTCARSPAIPPAACPPRHSGIHVGMCSLSPRGPPSVSPLISPSFWVPDSPSVSVLPPTPSPCSRNPGPLPELQSPFPSLLGIAVLLLPAPLLCHLSVPDHSQGLPSLAFPAPVLQPGVKSTLELLLPLPSWAQSPRRSPSLPLLPPRTRTPGPETGASSPSPL